MKRVVPAGSVYGKSVRRSPARVIAVGGDRLQVVCSCGWTGPAWLRNNDLTRIVLNWELDLHVSEHEADGKP